MGIEFCFAAHWDVPLIFAQGDAAGCAEAEEQFAGVVTACVKRARSRDFAEGLDAAEARQLTASRATEAIARARTGKPRPFKPTLPMTVTVQMTTVAEAEKVAGRPASAASTISRLKASPSATATSCGGSTAPAWTCRHEHEDVLSRQEGRRLEGDSLPRGQAARLASPGGVLSCQRGPTPPKPSK